MVKDCKNATVKTCKMVNCKLHYYIRWTTVLDITCNFMVVYCFLEVKNNIQFTVNNRKLTFLEFPAFHFKFDVFFLLK